MRFKTLLLAAVLGIGTAHAQIVSPLSGSTGNPQRPTPAAPATTAPATPAPATAAPATATPSAASPTTTTTPHHRRTLAERFAAANTTHDGKLTLEQARAGRMIAVARDFDQIDKTKRGYVTLDDIKTHQSEQRAARRAARAAQPAAQPAATTPAAAPTTPPAKPTTTR